MARTGGITLGEDVEMSQEEKRQSNVLIIDDNIQDRVAIRQALSALGFGSYTDASDHASGLAKIQERKVTHILFSAPKTNMPADEFLQKAMELDSSLIAIATSNDPTIDDVFRLLSLGARGYLVKPFTSITVDESLNWATHGPPISEAILFAKDRNEALAALVLSSLDKLALTMRQSKQFATARREVPIMYAAWRRSLDMAFTFGKGGMMQMPKEFYQLLIDRADGPASNLGRFRKRLSKRKAHLEKVQEKRKAIKALKESDKAGASEP
jgi:DNA-binding NarL/FixJ family response regulator